MGNWEVGVGAGRFCRTSSGGGTGKTTGEALEGSLLTNKTSMGPDVLLRRIWYFRCPLRTCTHAQSETWAKQQPDLREENPLQTSLTDSGMGTSSCVPIGARMARRVSPVEGGGEWEQLLLSERAKCLQIQACETITFKCSTEIFVLYIGHSMNVLSAAATTSGTQTRVLNSTPSYTNTNNDWQTFNEYLKEFKFKLERKTLTSVTKLHIY